MSKCIIEDCFTPAKYKGLCGKHYKRQWRHGDPLKTHLREYNHNEVCKVEDCDRRAKSSDGYGAMHWTRLHRHGRLFTVKAEPGTGAINAAGYRLLTINGARVYEHILIVQEALGKQLPEGVIVHHVNGKPADNRNKNLVVCPDQAYHLLLHRRQKQLGISLEDY